MLDILERLENTAEAEYFKILQPDGRLKCACNKLFAADKGGGIISSNPYAMPVCGNCFNEWEKSMEDKMLNECKPKREAEVSGQIAHLEKVIAEASESIASLKERLEPILKLQAPTTPEIGAVKSAAPESDIVPLAATIRQFRVKLQKSNNDIRDMIDTCEL